MKKSSRIYLTVLLAFGVTLLFVCFAYANPTIFPTGVTLYKPDKAWNGYTIPSLRDSATSLNEYSKSAPLLDMNGNIVHKWYAPKGFCFAHMPIKMLPGGYIMAAIYPDNSNRCFRNDLIQLDWDSNVVWRIKGINQHHDFERSGNPCGYYSPGIPGPDVKNGTTLVNSWEMVKKPKITDKLIWNTVIKELDWEGKVIWSWSVADHWDEFEFTEETKNAYYRNPGYHEDFRAAIATYCNNVNTVGPNKWYDNGDERFNPENVITDIRALNCSFIISKKTGKIVWKLGPYFTQNEKLRKIGQIIGQHHVHVIPKGLPGEGNILLFDNGGMAGWGAPNPGSIDGLYNAQRYYSRVIELDPVNMKIVWEYSAPKLGYNEHHWSRFFSPFVSSSQRLPNGNTLITEGHTGCVFEVTRDYEKVWEWVNPFFERKQWPDFKNPDNMVFRAYRYPYKWVPQLREHAELPVVPPKLSEFRIKPTDLKTYEQYKKAMEAKGAPRFKDLKECTKNEADDEEERDPRIYSY